MIQRLRTTTSRLIAGAVALAGATVLLTDGYRLLLGSREPDLPAIGLLGLMVYGTYHFGHYCLRGHRAGGYRR
ncbi:hypothetical protein H4F99_11160 [Lysobacter sp. SG-8]|uniref:Uncharacterized protein n=1 Tax=Marilutibacter penaei TaxID=2759900 RepID=A0A7W3U514_9GAMM|nr:hypothetical protein [Lysobacter penaei]MBB1089048.1 hypothetical protein [Lysobacter penaei]